MNTSEFLSYLRGLDIRLYANGDRLRCNAPKGALTPQIRDELARRKTEIISFLNTVGHKISPSPDKSINPITREGDLPLSLNQQRLWFLEQLEPGSPFYNISTPYRIMGSLDGASLEKSLRTIIQRHEILRTTFPDKDGVPCQVISTEINFALPVIDLRELPRKDRESEVQKQAFEEARRPFDLIRGPLLRCKILRIDETEHILLLTVHHIIFDVWSFDVFKRELIQLYNAFCQGKSSPLSELPIQYADFALWQQQWLKDEVIQSQLAYWEKQLERLPDLLRLPTDRPRPAVQTLRGAYQAITFPPDLYKSLKTLSRQEGVTFFMTLLAAFKVLLYCYTGQTDIAVGSPVTNRNREELEGLIGFFVNTLVLRTQLSGDITFRDLLSRIRKMALEAYDHQYLPFEMLVEHLQPQRNMSHTPLFQVMFALQKSKKQDTELAGLVLTPVKIDYGIAKFDLTLYLTETSDTLYGTVEYNTDLFNSSTIRQMLNCYHKLLEEIVYDPVQPISQLKLLSEEERGIILTDWNRTERVYPSEDVVHRMFEQQAERTPEAIAVIFENQQMTYRQLNEAANDLAEQLLELGICPDAPVGIMMERSLEMSLAVLGVLKAGGTYVPLDHTYPADRLSFILEDTQAKVLLTQQNFSDLLPPNEHQVLYLDGRASQFTGNGKRNPENSALPGHAAYLIYTSGSTGKPKGIVMGHGALSNLINWQIENTTIDARARTLQFASLGFDVSFQEMFSTWCTGGTLVLIPESLRRDIPGLLRFMDRMSVERIFVPFVVLQNLAEMAVSHKLIPRHLHEIITAGEQLQITPSIREFVSRMDHCTLHNQYGPSEAHVVTSYTLVGEPENWPKLPPIGRPIANVRIYILDQYMNPLPIGVPGELYIGGRSLAQGYLNRLELTEERFINNPFTHASGTRLYRTGDLARYLPDGNIEFLGRMDNQVKLRGFRIELGEIEAVLRANQSVQEAVVLLREDKPGDKHLVGYVVQRANETFSIEDLRSYLKRKLPDYMIPAFFVRLESLPLTPNGKVDKQALPAQDPYSMKLSGQLVEPRTPIEQALAQIWSDVLRLDNIGIQDNFFHLGGHSLLATQIISRVNKTFGVSIPVVDLFVHPTVSEFASEMESIMRQEGFEQVPQIKPVERKAEMPLSFAQQRLWFLDQLNPNSPSYNIPLAIELNGALDQESLQKSIHELVRRHESLRSHFDIRDSQPVQLIDIPRPVDIPVIELSGISDSDRETEIHRLIKEELLQPFDLKHGPLLRVKLLRITKAKHIMLLTIHHIVSDGWSMGVLFHELTILYRSYTKGRPSPLPELPVQYADFAVWQRNWLSGEELASQMSYWSQQLLGELSVLNLPTDYPYPAIQTFNGASESIQLSKELSESLKALSHHEHVTLFMTLLAAFKVLLYRYTGQEDIIVGSPVANRNRVEIENLIGFFVNMLVLRSQVSDTQSFLDLLVQVRETTLGAYVHQDLPFEKLVDEIETDRDLSRSALFQVAFALQNAPMEPLDLVGLQIKPVKMDCQTTRFELEVHVWERAGQLKVIFIYNRDLFAPFTIERMMNHYRVLLEGIVSNPECRISELPLLSELERQTLLEDWNWTYTEYQRDACIHQLFESRVQSNPDALAIVFKDQELTYSQLNEQANQLAHHLRSLGIKRGSLVAVCLERSIEMVVSMLGILKAGGAYVPLDLSYPAQRLSFMLQDTGSNVIITCEDLSNRFSEEDVQVVCLDRNKGLINTRPLSNPDTEASGDDLAYVMYTSGSTGKPKGIVMGHGALCNLINWQIENTTIDDRARTLQFASLGFDVSFQEMFSTWCTGGTLVLIPESLHRDILGLLRFMDQMSVERIFVPFVVLQNMAEIAVSHNLIPCHLHEIITAGEQLQITPSIREFVSRLDHCTLHNQYGPSEAHVVTSYTLEGEPENWPKLPPIGRPIANVRIYILDQDMNPLPIGVPGELYIGGRSLAHGYLNRPELTEKRFINNPFTHESGTKLYRTGDLARYLPDGNIEFLGRIDNQVKLRGFRIELGEIESVLRAHESVKEAVVLLREDKPGDKRLAGYVVPRANEAFSIEDLRSYLKRKLPEYMIPTFFIRLESLPLTPNGKVDKRALPAPNQSILLSGDTSSKFVGPRTPVEQALVEIWSDVLGSSSALGVNGIGIHDNFFHLGGHSLLATQVISRVNETFGLSIPVAALFEHPTVSEFAGEMESIMRQDGSEQVPKIKPAERKAQMPLSFAQQRLWFISQLDQDSHLYNISTATELKGQLNKEALQKTLNELFRRHESLRTRFDLRNGQPVQLIDPPGQVNIPVMDLGEVVDSDREREAHRLVREESLRPFDLKQGPLLRVKLIRITDTDHILLLTMHHIVSDGWSLGVLFHELAVLYESYTKGRQSPLPELPIQYADFAVWQRDWLSGEVLALQMSYWRQQLSGELPVLNLPTDYPRPAIQTFNGALQSIQLSRELSDSLKALSHSEHITLFMTLLSAFKILLHRYTGQEDIIVGSPVANRNRVEIEGLIGFFINMLVLRSKVSGTQGFKELLSQVRKTTLGAYTHQDLPFEKLVDEFETDRDLSRSALFQVTFSLQNAPMPPLELVGLQLKPMGMECQTTRFDLEVHVWEKDGQIRVIFIYNRDLFVPPTIERMMNNYRVLLEGIVSDPDCQISRLPYISESERQKLLGIWSQAQTDYPRQSSIPELFQLQVKQDPDAVAIVSKDQQLTYSKLNERANQLAHHLRSLGVKKGSLVAVCIERSLEMVISMLGILKAGAAYVPLDVSYPAQRLSFMLQDTGSHVLLTREGLLDRFSNDGVQVVCLDRDKDLINTRPVSDPEMETSGDELAYVMYTSGSTGAPKGVEILHRGVVRLVCKTDYIQLGAADRVAHISNCSFDASTFEVWGALLSGARLVVLDQDTVLSPGKLTDRLKGEGISVLFLTTALFNLLAKESSKVLAGIDNLLFGGEAADPQQVRKVADENGTGRLLHVYGPTENTTFTTWYEVSSVPEEATTVPIGRPIANTKVCVLDSQMEPVPVGVPGELYIGGDGLARGYLNRPELTAERFVDDPFSEEQGSHLYRTGDMARWLPEGILEFLGRKDDQVKLRGFRIELGEIEAVLRNHESIQDAVVLLREDEPGEKYLVAYVVPHKEDLFYPDDLRSYLRKSLPNYMVPSYFMQLKSLPLTPNGKIDRQALPLPGSSTVQIEEDYVAPRTPMEKMLAEIWQEVLGVERVGVHENFFDLGGHSLKVMEVISKLEEGIGLRINPMELMMQNLAQVAVVCEKEYENKQKSKLQREKTDMFSILKKMVKDKNK